VPLLSRLKSMCVTGFIVLLSQIATSETLPEQQANDAITQLYHSHVLMPTAPISRRIAQISAQSLEKPYLLGALGEGDQAQYDQFPLYRLDAFDCETFVDTVIALAKANNLTEFKRLIRHIRYKKGQVSFITRNHFTCLDWNKNNQQQGFTKDITATIQNQQHHSVAMMAYATIDKPNWYKQLPITRIRLPHASIAEKEKRLTRLRQQGQQFARAQSMTPYIPLSILFDSSGKPDESLFHKIPNGAIIEIVRPNWNLTDLIGTHLNVSHLGFAIRTHGQLMFRAATSTNHRVLDVPLVDYLRETLKSPTIKGINIQVVC
jgi:hypothetical protein